MSRRAWAVAIVAAGAVLAVAGTVALRQPTGGAAARPAPGAVVDRGVVPTVSHTTAAPRPAAASSTSVPGSASRPAPLRTVPAGSRLLIPRLGVNAGTTTVRATAGEMGVPKDPRRVGWWRDGAAPGAASGSAVLVGHVNYAGVQGALARLPDLVPGDRIVLDEPRTRLRYRVAAVKTYPKSRGLPASAFARTGPPRLVLITCGGPFDPGSGNYEDNVVVWAVPA